MPFLFVIKSSIGWRLARDNKRMQDDAATTTMIAAAIADGVTIVGPRNSSVQ